MGDRILKVNGTDVTAATHQEAVMELLRPGDEIKLTIQHDPLPVGFQVSTGRSECGPKLRASQIFQFVFIYPYFNSFVHIEHFFYRVLFVRLSECWSRLFCFCSLFLYHLFGSLYSCLLESIAVSAALFSMLCFFIAASLPRMKCTLNSEKPQVHK